jgi:hypothetical protein
VRDGDHTGGRGRGRGRRDKTDDLRLEGRSGTTTGKRRGHAGYCSCYCVATTCLLVGVSAGAYQVKMDLFLKI